MVSLNLCTTSLGYCSACKGLKNKDFYLDKNALPIWRKDSEAIYTLPECLQTLSHAEKMLIQRISPFVPLHHIKNGVFGLTGHVCAFEQDIEGFVNSLPRQRKDVTMLKVLKTVKTEICGSRESTTVAFRVRKKKVREALEFLVEHNQEYKDVVIDMTALDWIEAEEGTLDPQILETNELLTAIDDTAQNADLGPAPKQTILPKANGDDINVFGYIDAGAKAPLSERNQAINEELQQSVLDSPNKQEIAVDWPALSASPICEYGSIRLFVNAFPWLFPGGVGDAKDFPTANLGDWGKMMLLYQDGRFAKDKIFGFFAMNYIIRHRNSSSGQWFIKTFHTGCPDSIEELKEQIKEGNTSFVNSLFYFNSRVVGSTPYWFKKRCELYSWINYHVASGNGAPMYFITLSCAEMLWPDIIRLIQQRMELSGDNTEDCNFGSKNMTTYTNDYSIVIQEYFQKRVLAWLDTVGKTVFCIKHYWIRYEFAPGRGQIHAHLLAIPSNQGIYELCHMDLMEPNGNHKRAVRLSDWASQRFGLTASVSDTYDNLNVTWENSPAAIRFMDVAGKGPKEREHDVELLMKHVQEHECNGFCLRDSKGKNS